MTVDVMMYAGEVTPERVLHSSVAVIDVFRATSVIVEALQNGARAVVPVVTVEEAREMAARMGDFPSVHLRGLMAIPPISQYPGENCKYFAEMRKLFVDISEKTYDNVHMDCLSMGMTHDYVDAILEGATLVRIGTGIYGPRIYKEEMP